MHYLWLSVLSILFAVLLANLAKPLPPLWGDIRVKHAWNAVPGNWESLGPPPAGATINLHIALTPRHENALIDALESVSNPRHKKYRKYLSKQKVAELVAPHQDTLDIVHSWLAHHGVPSSSISTSHGGGWLTISGVPVSQADELLCASYQVYRHIGTNGTQTILRTVSYGLPAVLHAHVRTVAPTTHFASPSTSLHKRSSEEAVVMMNGTSGETVRVLSSRGKNLVQPSYLRWVYETAPYVPAAMGQNTLGVLGFQYGNPTQADLRQFMTQYRPDAAAATFTVVQLTEEYDLRQTESLTSINTQYAASMIYPIPLVFYEAGSKIQWSNSDNMPAPGDVYLTWLNYIVTHPNTPPTISVSYFDPESAFPLEYAEAVCELFGRLGALGVSVLVASGDHGVGQGSCADGSGNVGFMPSFPASCPWLTSVGGTTNQAPEIAASLSGGGFSRHFARPSYQNQAVIAYLGRLGDVEYAGRYNPNGRGIPDISAQAERFAYIRKAEARITSGTGCSTPTVAGIVSLLNDYLISTGQAPLGFLNPWLYEFGRFGINDIMSGSNPGCNTNGFPATTGWDPVTGLGSPRFLMLLPILGREIVEWPNGELEPSGRPSL